MQVRCVKGAENIAEVVGDCVCAQGARVFWTKWRGLHTRLSLMARRVVLGAVRLPSRSRRIAWNWVESKK
jgi:hypothetical protein